MYLAGPAEIKQTPKDRLIKICQFGICFLWFLATALLVAGGGAGAGREDRFNATDQDISGGVFALDGRDSGNGFSGGTGNPDGTNGTQK